MVPHMRSVMPLLFAFSVRMVRTFVVAAVPLDVRFASFSFDGKARCLWCFSHKRDPCKD